MERFRRMVVTSAFLLLIGLIAAHWHIVERLVDGIRGSGISFSGVLGAAIQGYVIYVVIIFFALLDAAWPSVPVCCAIGCVAGYIAGGLAAGIFRHLTDLP
ncbi:hypothetical protein L596_026629 [Steinernema carpocapsae]|uniref:Copper transporter n=1 Tax=Steinernema carpocapsae TaxID=34508 RepID=A0A4U5M1X6_STECR|nr:hypothetical protein L596_026629 [Steinernema carpocapsae]